MALPAIIPKQKNIDDEIKEKSLMLVEVRNAIEDLETSFSQVDSHYRIINADLIVQIADLNMRIQNIAIKKMNVREKIEDTDTNQNQNIHVEAKDRPTRKKITALYRRICNLCHPDKINRKNLSAEKIGICKELYHKAQKAYSKRDYVTLRMLFDVVVSTLSEEKHVESQIKEDEENNAEELQEILNALIMESHRLYEMRKNALFAVLNEHVSRNYSSASNIYRRICFTQIANLQNVLNSLAYT